MIRRRHGLAARLGLLAIAALALACSSAQPQGLNSNTSTSIEPFRPSDPVYSMNVNENRSIDRDPYLGGGHVRTLDELTTNLNVPGTNMNAGTSMNDNLSVPRSLNVNGR